jgi:PAS domain S-box-containing protein
MLVVDPRSRAIVDANPAAATFHGWPCEQLTVRRTAEEAQTRLVAALRLQSAALDAAANAMVITDCDGTVVWVNRAFCELTGYAATEAIGKNPRDLVKSGVHDQALYAELWRTIRAGQLWRGELTNRRKDGTLYPEMQTITPVTDGGVITHFIAIKQDLTEQKALESQFLQSQKMEVVGLLAGGIAHDFNNLLTVIKLTAELAAGSLRQGDPLRADLEEIGRAGDRAASLTRQLLAFSRRQILNPIVLNAGTLVTNMAGMLQRLIGEDIHLTVSVADSLDSVRADHSQVEQVVLNLAVNARDAMPRGGRLALHLANELIDGVPHVVLAVTDTGVGMDEITRRRIFEPFFTTKEPGKGTGLGLSTVYGIVKQSGGTIEVRSEPNAGATFRVCLPSVPDAPASTPGPRGDPAGREVGTLLLVEDEQPLANLTARMLKSAGYTVLSSANGEDALALLDRHEGGIDLMLTDIVMPGISGRELASRAASLRPGMRVLFTSGYTGDAIMRHGMLDDLAHFISKPYTRLALTAKVREVLGDTACAPATGAPA